MEIYKINVVQSLKESEMKDERNILNVFDKIKNEDLKIQIDQIRNTNDKVEQNLLKRESPCVYCFCYFQWSKKKI